MKFNCLFRVFLFIGLANAGDRYEQIMEESGKFIDLSKMQEASDHLFLQIYKRCPTSKAIAELKFVLQEESVVVEDEQFEQYCGRLEKIAVEKRQNSKICEKDDCIYCKAIRLLNFEMLIPFIAKKIGQAPENLWSLLEEKKDELEALSKSKVLISTAPKPTVDSPGGDTRLAPTLVPVLACIYAMLH